MTKKIKVAVIGVGHLGQHHARIYSELPDSELVCVVDNNQKQGEKIASKLNVPFFSNYKEIKDNVDAVSIVVPTTYHFEIAKYFLSHGIHTLIEKPVTQTVEHAEQLEQLVSKNNLILQVGHIERFNPAWLAVSEYVSNPKFIEIHRLAPYKGRSVDVGVVLDLMIHDIDIVLTILNKKIIDIRSSGLSVLGGNEDIVNARIEFEGGCVANINASRISSKEMRKFRIFQPNSYISIDYKKQSARIYTIDNGKIKTKKIKTFKDEPLKLELKDFIKCVDESGEPKVSITHGKQAIKAALDIVKQIK